MTISPEVEGRDLIISPELKSAPEAVTSKRSVPALPPEPLIPLTVVQVQETVFSMPLSIISMVGGVPAFKSAPGSCSQTSFASNCTSLAMT